jgi:RNA polymerase sigma-70 factor (ECF subfamily)
MSQYPIVLVAFILLGALKMEQRSSQPIFDPNTLVDQYADYLFRYALLHVRDRSVAEDVVQETFLAALESYGGFSGQSSLKTWLLGILKHKIIDHFRKNWRQAQFTTNDIEADLAEGAYATFSPATSDDRFVSKEWHANPETKIERNAFWKVLAKGLAGLNSRTATAFALREIEQLSTRDVCERMQISESNLWVMLHRARRHLRECFELNWTK